VSGLTGGSDRYVLNLTTEHIKSLAATWRTPLVVENPIIRPGRYSGNIAAAKTKCPQSVIPKFSPQKPKPWVPASRTNKRVAPGRSVEFNRCRCNRITVEGSDF
jgi:hypothetical protein